MLIKTTAACTDQQLEAILSETAKLGFRASITDTRSGRYIVCVGAAAFDIRKIGNLPGVEDVHHVSDQNKLVSRQWKVETSRISLQFEMEISRSSFQIAMGPCSIESVQQLESMIEFLKANDIGIMRGGVFKPRSSPYSFRGLGLEGLRLFSSACRAAGICIVSEVMQVSQIPEMYDYVDVFQVGTRNAQNYNLLDELGKTDKPVLLKRGMSSTLDEFLASAEYIFSGGNEQIVLCERGIRSFEKAYRNTLDLNAIPYLKEKSHLPVFCDPSHGTGVRRYVESLSLAAVMAGADGLLVEIHETPEKALSDGDQTLNYAEAARAIGRIRETLHLRRYFEEQEAGPID